MNQLKHWPKERKNLFEIRKELLDYEMISHFHEFEKNLFDEGPHLTSSSTLPLGDSVWELVSDAKRQFE